MDEIVQLVSTIGFPMVACVYIYMDSRKDKERLYDTIDKFGDTLTKFGDTMECIDHRLERLEGYIDG